MKSAVGLLLLVSLFGARAAGAPAVREREAEAEMVKAKQAMQRELYEVAVGHLLVARSLAPEASGPYLNLGIAYQHLGRCQDAVPMIEEYLRKKPKSPQPSAAATLERCKATAASEAAPAAAATATRAAATPIAAPPTAATPTAATPTAVAPPAATASPPPRTAVPTIATATTTTAPAGAGDAAATSRTTAVHTTAALSGSDPSSLPPLAWLTIHIDPVAANVTLDGRRVGDGIRVFERALPGGVYNLSIGRRGYTTLARQVRLDPGQQLYQTLTLHKQVWPIVVGVLAGLVASAAIVVVGVLELRPASSAHPTNSTSLLGGFRFSTGSL
jgi:hypothetical protein